MNAATKLKRLRELMSKHQVHAYVIPSADAHQSEYVSASDQRRAFISDFTGSAGTAVVTMNKAFLFTDGRYFLQAQKQLDPSHWTLVRQGIDPTITQILQTGQDKLEPSSVVGVDPYLFSFSYYKTFAASLGSGTNKLQLRSVVPNLVDLIWENKPKEPSGAIFPLETSYSGLSHEAKIETIRKELAEKKCDMLIIAALDEIAWTLNLRGSDVAFNPVFMSYLIIGTDSITLFVDEAKVSDSVRKHIGSKIMIKPYQSFGAELLSIVSNIGTKKIWIDAESCNSAIGNAIPEANLVDSVSPVKLLKSIKNETERQGLRNCHVRDGVAVVKFLAWLKHMLETDPSNPILTEFNASTKLEQFRSEQSDYVSLSFATIAGSGPNGAIIHYSPEESSCAHIQKDKMFLLDSGAQYKDGTTDITRTVHFGIPTEHEKECYTRVLQGHIALDTAVFPEGITGYKLDVLARQFLWKIGLDYLHGTGHGVGHFLNVHEGPHGVGFRKSTDDFALKEHMTITNEPGYYENGSFGIRIENIMLVKQVQTPFQFNFKKYLGFEHITCVPIQTSLIKPELLVDAEKQWVNDYNQWCISKLLPHLGNDKQTIAYMNELATPLK